MLTYADVCRYGVNKALTEEEMALLCHVCRQHQQNMRAQERERQERETQDDDSLRERWQGERGREQLSPGTQFTCFTGLVQSRDGKETGPESKRALVLSLLVQTLLYWYKKVQKKKC
jgi:hypothetical protein